MKQWVIAAAAFVPAMALATPITFTTASGKTVTAKVKTKNTGTTASPANSSTATPTSNTTTAAANGSGGIGNARASDVTLGGISASELIYGAGVNPQQGPNGNSSGFASAYAGSGSGDWSSFAKFSGTSNLGAINSTLSGLTLTMAFGLTDLRHGTWSITNNNAANNLSLDLVFAMHTGGGSGSWLFDNYLLNAGSTALGTWSLNLLNNGGQLADYSNLTLFARNAVASAVPAPAPAPTPVASAPAAGTPAPAPAPVPTVEPTPAPVLIPVLEEVVTVIPPLPTPVSGNDTTPAAGPGDTAPAAGVTETVSTGGSAPAESTLPAPAESTQPAPAESAPATGTPPGNGGISIQIPIGELLQELIKHGNIEPGTEIEFEGLFGNAPSSKVPEPGALAMFMTGLAVFGASLRQRKRRANRA